MRPMHPARVVVHNLRVNRRPIIVAGEVRQLVAAEQPEVCAVVEAWQYGDTLAHTPGYRYLCRRGASPSERDAGLLVRRGVPVRRFGLVRTRTSWPRTKGAGQHWPRSFPWIDVELDGRWVRVVVMHWPRNLPANRLAIAECWVRLLALMLRTPRPILLVGDTNQGVRSRRLWSPRQLARTAGAKLTGRGIMHAIHRGMDVAVAELDEHQRGSDHAPLEVELRPRSRAGD